MFIKSLFDGFKSGKIKNKKYRQGEFDYLPNAPVLHSSHYLNELYSQSQCDDHLDSILTHIYQYEAHDIPSYKRIEQKILKERW